VPDQQVHEEEQRTTDLAGAIYGIVLATAMIGAFSQDKALGNVQIAVAVFVTAVVFWVAHAYARVVASGLVRSRGLSWREIRGDLAREVPIVAGAVPSILVLFLNPIGLLGHEAAQTAAISLGVVLLAACGLIAGIRQGAGTLGVLVMCATSAALGIVIVGLKVFIH